MLKLVQDLGKLLQPQGYINSWIT